MRLAVTLLLLGAACSRPAAGPAPQNGGGGATTTAPVTAERTVVFPADHARHDVFEGPTFRNTCASDGECHAGGCSGEVCTAEEGVQTACVVHPDQPRDATCGCVRDACVWYRAEAAASGDGAEAAQGDPCADGRCAQGLSCVGYYGIAGPRGPRFTSCEIPCGLAKSVCPEGQQCVTIADGPGAVCRPR
jgi:eight-cysteine-cluster-containing protein